VSLSIADHIARSGLSVASSQVGVVTRNLSAAQIAGASRKIAKVITVGDGSAYLASISRVSDQALFQKATGAASANGTAKALAAAFAELSREIIGDPGDERSPAAVIGGLRDRLEVYAEQPSDYARAAAAVAAARDVASALVSASTSLRDVRERVDGEIAASVEAVNANLSKLETLNGHIVAGTISGADMTDALDDRDRLLMDIAGHIGIRVLPEIGNDIVVTTDSGIVLYQNGARQLSFATSAPLPEGAPGNPVLIDGADASSRAAGLGIRSGAIAGLVAIRDDIAVAAQKQLDEIARGLVTAFAERDQTGGTAPDLPGLFTWPGATSIPPAGAVMDGLAARLQVAALVDPSVGGNPLLLRDGGISGSAGHVSNASGAAGFRDRLHELLAGFDTHAPFDPSAGAGSEATLAGYAQASAAWLADGAQRADRDAEFNGALMSRAAEAHSNATGINLDVEMAHLLELEHSYQASARLIATVGAMLDTLLAAIQ